MNYNLFVKWFLFNDDINILINEVFIMIILLYIDVSVCLVKNVNFNYDLIFKNIVK